MNLRFLAAGLFISALFGASALRATAANAPDPGAAAVSVAYQLPADGPLPRTYRVTLAITDPKNPDWLVSTFAAGVVRTVTVENGGKFSEKWNGLDDNFMPVPPGEYGVKGIFMPAQEWPIDGEYHTVVPQFITGAFSFLSPDPTKPEPFSGDPVGSPPGDVAVGPNGVAVFYYSYLENGKNNPMIDLKKPIGFDQVITAFPSGGAGGGTSTTTDGTSVWSFSIDGHPKFVYRADGKRFGTGRGNSRQDMSYIPKGWVTALANWVDPQTKKSTVYVAERGKMSSVNEGGRHDRWFENDKDPVDVITALDGDNGATIGSIAASSPRGLAVHGNNLYVLQAEGKEFIVSRLAIEGGKPTGKWEKVLSVGAGIVPGGLAIDGHGNIYVSDPAGNQVYRYDDKGAIAMRYGKGGAQKPGPYDPLILMRPVKIAAWTDAEGHDRLLILELAGPARYSEWSSDGKLMREWMSFQTKANDAYAIDPLHPGDVYLPGQDNWLIRFKVDFAAKVWKVDAVWPNVGDDPKTPRILFPRLIRANGNTYLAGEKTWNIYRLAGDKWVLSSAVIREAPAKGDPTFYYWHDADNNGKVDESEYRDTPATLPPGAWKYWGQRWLEDLSLVAVPSVGRDVWRLAPSGFDAHGNPIFKEWQKLLTDSVLEARTAKTADAIHGGNEMDDQYGSSWSQIDGNLKDGFYVSARGVKGFSANNGAQQKLSRYVPDGKGGYTMKWRTGRAALGALAAPGEIYGAIHVRAAINGLVSVVDQSRCGLVLYTDEGLYVDTLFPDSKTFKRADIGLYALPGEFFAGDVVANQENGKIYFAFGKYTPLLYEAVGWSLKENPVRKLTDLPKTVSLAGPQIAPPPDVALSFRGGVGTAKFARVNPAIGGVALDGSMTGWESAAASTFSADKNQPVEVRCLYDPTHFYIRWHVRLASKFEPKALDPVERIFTHDRLADTVSLYFQSDPNAKPGSKIGRPGDVRIVFGLFDEIGELKPVALGMYPHWADAATAKPMKYVTPVGTAEFAHVAPIKDAKLGYAMDPDQKGFVICAALPAAAFPQLPPMGAGLRTFINFEATLNGHNKFWWADTDLSASRETYDEPTEARLYPGSWAPVQFLGLDDGVIIQNWSVLGPFGGPGAEKFNYQGGPFKDDVHKFFAAKKFPPDDQIDYAATYKGEEIEGYWKDAGVLRWKPAKIEDLDTRVELGLGAQMWYASTWIHSPEDKTIDASLQSGRMTTATYYLNGEPIKTGKFIGDSGRQKFDVPLALKKGWNEVRFRGYCVGYPPVTVGLVLLGPTKDLWSLRLSGTPPKQ